MFNNVDQIMHLQLDNKFQHSNKKSGKWRANWSGHQLQDVGGYYDNGLKQGLWNELRKNFSSKAQVFENGEYLSDQKVGKWNYVYYNKIIGGGLFNSQGQRNGKWIELSEEFSDYSQVTYKGEYKNSKKVGEWDIFFRNENQKKYKRIGGGIYYIGVKFGKWIELCEKFYIYSKVTYYGEYQNGKKVGRWDAYFNQEGNHKIGGGQYQEVEGHSIKIGNWIELSELFQSRSQVTYKGEYQNGEKVGRWDILFRDQRQNKYQQLGGGFCEGGVKIGKWIELSDHYQTYAKVTYHGEYQDGKKVGRWNTFGIGEQIGGGLYYEVEGVSIKIGRWIELSDGFNLYSEVAYNGEYKNGKKVGRWDILYREEGKQSFQVIGGGEYDEQGLRNGKWIELDDGFQNYSQVIHNGEYRNGKKVGLWDIQYRETRKQYYQLIGGGLFNEQGQKNGNWVELNEEFSNYPQTTYNSQYKNGRKVSRWESSKNDNLPKMAQR